MDQVEDQKLLDAAKLVKYCFLRRSVEVVISAFVLSLFFFYHPGLFFFSYSLAHTVERKYMFLICNGILAFLTKSSVSRCESYSDEAALSGKVPVVSNPPEAKTPVVDEVENVEDQLQVFEEAEEEREDEQGSGNQPYDQDNSHEANNLSTTSAENEDLEEDENGGRFSIKQEEEEMADEEFTNTDELNKKFEEFIRKMKEELRIQAQQELITV